MFKSIVPKWNTEEDVRRKNLCPICKKVNSNDPVLFPKVCKECIRKLREEKDASLAERVLVHV